MAVDPDSLDSVYVVDEHSGGSAYASDKKRVAAGLQFSVSAVRRILLSHKRGQQIGRGGPVYLAAVLEYLSAEIAELAGNIAKKAKRTHVTSDDVAEAIFNDEELRKLFGFVRVPSRQIKPTLIPATSTPSATLAPAAATPAPAPALAAAVTVVAAAPDGKTDGAEAKGDAKHPTFSPPFNVEPESAPILAQTLQKNKKIANRRLLSSAVVKSDFIHQIALVMKQVHLNLSYTELAIHQVQNLIIQYAHKAAEEAFFLAKTKGSSIITSREIQTAIRLGLPGELAKHAVSEGTKGVTKFYSATH